MIVDPGFFAEAFKRRSPRGSTHRLKDRSRTEPQLVKPYSGSEAAATAKPKLVEARMNKDFETVDERNAAAIERSNASFEKGR
jgi:hypothetical protein